MFLTVVRKFLAIIRVELNDQEKIWVLWRCSEAPMHNKHRVPDLWRCDVSVSTSCLLPNGDSNVSPGELTALIRGWKLVALNRETWDRKASFIPQTKNWHLLGTIKPQKMIPHRKMKFFLFLFLSKESPSTCNGKKKRIIMINSTKNSEFRYILL